MSEWFHIDVGQQQHGPLSAHEMVERFRTGKITADTPVWRNGQPEWQPLRSVAQELGLILPPAAPQPAPPPVAGREPKSRVTYILWGVFLGAFGAHNFYARRTGVAVAQLLITVLSLGYLSIVPAIWMFIELFTVKVDGDGTPMI